jgi:hypothetical protein
VIIFGLTRLAALMGSGNKLLGVLPFLLRSMMSLGRSSAIFTFLWLLLDPRLLRVDLIIVWSNVNKDATLMEGRQTS